VSTRADVCSGSLLIVNNIVGHRSRKSNLV
jgi:hypothetical protein